MSTKHTPSNEQQILDYLEHDLGFDVDGDAAALGNFEQESGWRPTAVQAGTGATGIAQWQGGRRAALAAYASAHGQSIYSLSAQLGYLGEELRGPYRSVLNAMRTATNPAQAANIWNRDFEISADYSDTREINADRIYAQLAAGKTLNGGGGSASSGSSFLGSLEHGAGDVLGIPSDIASAPADAASAAVDGVTNAVGSIAMKLAFVGVGLVLVILGVYVTAKPATDKAAGDAAAIAPLAMG